MREINNREGEIRERARDNFGGISDFCFVKFVNITGKNRYEN